MLSLDKRINAWSLPGQSTIDYFLRVKRLLLGIIAVVMALTGRASVRQGKSQESFEVPVFAFTNVKSTLVFAFPITADYRDVAEHLDFAKSFWNAGFPVYVGTWESQKGRFLPLIGKISASAYTILCKEDVRIGKGENNVTNSRNLLV